MSIPHSNSDTGTPHLYLLEMDSNINLRTSDPQLLPLHFLNNITDYNYKQFLRNKQLRDEDQDQNEVLIDASPESVVKFVAIQAEKTYHQNQKQILPSFAVHHDNVIPLASPSCEPQLIAPSLVNSSDHAESRTYKKVKREKEIQHYVHISDRTVLPRAIAVLPTVLHIRQKNMISPRRVLPPRTRFGPVQGLKTNISSMEMNNLTMSSMQNKSPIFLVRETDESITHIDVSDKDKANWIGLLPLGDDNTANVWIYEENNELFIITTEVVPMRKQLMLGYSKNYAQDYGIIGPTRDIETALSSSQKSWWCYECQRAMLSAALLERHMATYHQADTANTRRYRCKHCSRTFSRISTLRRHIARHCDKKPSKSDAIATTEIIPDTSLNSSLNTDDNRIPSDESFQNYSNGLDFSTNLFDTDRMPSLDISGNSRCEVFNPYGLDSENDLGYTNGSANKTDISPSMDDKKQAPEQNTQPVIATCPYCKQDVVKGKKRQHVSECPARRFECECKKVFPTKEQLGLHIFTQHLEGKVSKEEEQEGEDNSHNAQTTKNAAPYQCEQCQHSFKRRGMLVNHLWRVHKMAAARVPLERRVRHYPCTVCPKIYRTAAKRDRHITVHHPGVERPAAAPLDGGTRPCSPAACPACPRQYATRAKLLQHLRYRHPHLAPPPPNKTNLTQKSNKTNERLKASEDLFKNKTSLQQLLNFY